MIAAIQPKTRQILGVNQQAYQSLKASMSLNLRRQLLIAVCDNVVLQNQLSAQLERDLAQETWFSPQFDAGPPKAVSLSLERLIFDPEDAHLPRQVAHWVRQVALSEDRFIYGSLPQVQVVGIEQMTRQPAIIQSHFLRSLEQIEALLPRLNTSLLVWVPWPWLRTIQSSSPTFWKWRNAVFEFVSDPTPALMPSDKSRLSDGKAALPKQLGGQVGSQVGGQVGGQIARQSSSQLNRRLSDPASEQNSRSDRPPAINDYPSVIAHDVVALYGETDDSELGDGDQPVLENIVNWDAVDVSAVSMQSEQTNSPTQSSALQRTRSNALAAGEAAEDVRTANTDSALLAAIQAASSRPQIPEPVDAQGLTKSQRQEIQSREAARLEAQRLRAQAAAQREAAQREIAQREAAQKEAHLAETQAAEAQFLAEREALFQSQYDQLNEQLNSGSEFESDYSATDSTEQSLLDQPLLEQSAAQPQDAESIHGAADDYFEVGRSYRQRIEAGERGLDMIEPAIAAYEGGLRCLSGPHPDWGSGLNDLGTLYWLKAQQLNDQQQVVDCMRHSVQLYSEALTKIDPAQEVNMACQLYSNLGAVYSMLATQIDPLAYFKQAAEAYQNSIALCAVEEDPEEFATLQNSLGSVYWKLSHYEQESEQVQLYLRQAVTAYEQALLGYVPTQQPLDYAAVQNNLGITYWSLAKHAMPVAALKNAIAAYRDALNYRTPDSDPAACAITYNNLALAYWDLSKEGSIDLEPKIRYQRNAVTAFEAALQTAATVGSLSQSDSAAIYHCLGDVHAQMAENAPSLSEVADSLQKSLYSYVKAIEGMPTESAVFQARLTAIIANLKSHQEHLGLASQQAALNRVPSHLVSEVMQAL
ncbi:MAG: hypothetical protein AAFQ63_01720 [Cyanobacteria bacterium J06621_11]